MFKKMFSLQCVLIKTVVPNVTKRLICVSLPKQLSSQTTPENTDSKTSGYAQAFKKFETINEEAQTKPESFVTLLRKSKFMDLGDPSGKVVTGKIFHVVDDDLYIDFGWKFHCVCPRPKMNGSSYVRGANVRIRIKELEMSSKFLGFEKDLTLLEADCTLLGLTKGRKGRSLEKK
ncbi:small ribosomal subunit protein bS1m [Cylas formicarius]|uniref:small ribosomal subunit protein bS1m n=1 Tax=Cylas formicarius TaxID=197179 RepID=UPI00295832D8|nr:small ribosomal subunit protein bS1m [Cylas formicarius]